VLRLAGYCGFMVTSVGMILAFYPSPEITSKTTFEVKMWVGFLVLIGMAAFFFFVYGNRQRKAALTEA
jgi:hypothetical protein